MPQEQNRVEQGLSDGVAQEGDQREAQIGWVALEVRDAQGKDLESRGINVST